jgi:flagellar protein FlbT
MPLRLNLRPYEQIMINGAVITNLKRRAFLAIHNDARIIPGKLILQSERAVTPVRRIYFAAQMAYIYAEDPVELARWSEEFASRLKEVRAALRNEEVLAQLDEAEEAFAERVFYRTLRTLHDVMEYEEKLLGLGGNRPPPAFGDGLRVPPRDAGDHEEAAD